MLFSFFKTPKHQSFNYVPRYYNPEEEARQERIRRAKGEAPLLSSEKRINFKRQSGYQEAARKSNRNIIFIIFIISAVLFLIFSDFISLQKAAAVLITLIAWRAGLFHRLGHLIRKTKEQA